MVGLIFLLSVVSLASEDDPSNYNRMTSTDRMAATLLHFKVRQEVDPPAKVMQHQSYSMLLESMAQNWSSKCLLRTATPEDIYGVVFLGQNMATLHMGYEPQVSDFFDLWMTQASEYDFTANTCSGYCDHYIQIVWHDTTELGCAKWRCEPHTKTERYVFTCFYKPSGNYVGMRPYFTDDELGSDSISKNASFDKSEDTQITKSEESSALTCWLQFRHLAVWVTLATLQHFLS